MRRTAPNKPPPFVFIPLNLVPNHVAFHENFKFCSRTDLRFISDAEIFEVLYHAENFYTRCYPKVSGLD